jgi:small subunit ribosomal protein S18
MMNNGQANSSSNATAAGSTRQNGNSNGNGGQGRSKRRLSDFFIQNKVAIDYRNTDILRRFVSPEGKILPSRRTGLTSKNQRKITRAVKAARMIAFLPYASQEF